MKKIILSDSAQFTLDAYFNNYRGLRVTDMMQRSYHYHRIINILTDIDLFLDDVITVNDKNYIQIDNICVVEFEIREIAEIAIMEIYFNNDITLQQEYNPVPMRL